MGIPPLRSPVLPSILLPPKAVSCVRSESEAAAEVGGQQRREWKGICLAFHSIRLRTGPPDQHHLSCTTNTY